MIPGFLFVLMIAVAIGVRLIAGAFDGERVESYARENGWTLLDKSWDPFGPGWFGEKDSRIYQIAYRDQQGNVHKAHVKTSMLSGVYLTNDEIVEHARNAADRHENGLEEENERLRRKIRELEGGQS